MSKVIGYNGSNWYGWIATGQAGNNNIIMDAYYGSAMVMPETGYITSYSVYAAGTNGYTPKAQLYLYAAGGLAHYYNFTLSGGSESLGGQHWNTVSGLNILAPKGSLVEPGLWTDPNAWRVWSYASASGYEFVSDVQTNPPSVSSTVSNKTYYAGSTLGAYAVYTPAAPIISSYSESSGVVTTQFTITGYAFAAVSAVKINGVSCAFTINSDTSLTVTIAATATQGPVAVTNPYGTTNGPTFTPLAAPSISSYTPTSGGSGTNISISGHYFTGVTSTTINGVSCAFTINSDTSLTVTVASNATTGSLVITDPQGSTTAGTFTANTNYPVITSVNPTATFPNVIVTVSGSNFTGTSGVTVNGSACSFTVVSGLSLTFAIPLGVLSGPLVITNTYGATTGPNMGVYQVYVGNTSTNGWKSQQGGRVFAANTSSNGWYAWVESLVYVANSSTYVDIG